MELACLLAVGLVGGDEGGDGDGGAVSEELRDLLRIALVYSSTAIQIILREDRRTSAIRLMFSLRSFSLKPRSLLRPKRTLSPSRRYEA